MKNKKAQLGKIIATLPVLILVVIIMGLFIAIAAAITTLHKPSFETASPAIIIDNNLLLQTVEIEHKLNDETSAFEKYLVMDAVYLSLQEELNPDKESAGDIRKKIPDALGSLQKKTNNCYLLKYSYDIIIGRSIISEKDLFRSNDYENSLEGKTSFTNFNIEGKTMEVEHYFGTCPY